MEDTALNAKRGWIFLREPSEKTLMQHGNAMKW